ncbi:MAG: acyl-CoA thioesterase [Saprospiraceae bacterium]|nr:acyl-CoA thioesterase [Saprospiraceae bacterium]
MGYVYYGNYATYFEVARVEMLRSQGVSYASMEDSGVMMPVLETSHKFFKPGLYDDLLTIKTYIEEKPGVRVFFDYEVFNEKGDKLSIGKTTLVFVNKETGKPCNPPEVFKKAVCSKFDE